MEYLVSLLFIFIFVCCPIILTIRNVDFTFGLRERKIGRLRRLLSDKVSSRRNDTVIILFGAFCCAAYIGIITSGRVLTIDYDQPAYIGYYHAFLHTESEQSVYIAFLAAVVALLLLIWVPSDKLPPLPEALLFGFAVIGEVAFTFFIAQIAGNMHWTVLPLVIYLVNIIMIIVRLTRQYIIAHLDYNNEHMTQYRFDAAQKIEDKMTSAAHLTMLHFIMIFPAAFLLLMLFIFLGQGPDGIIKAFTDTADWTFSQQIPPPPVEYQGHYLCTVAAGGHEKIVKPVRYGRRRGAVIVCNRQLLASNAFEDLIMERAPRFHRAVRGFYDKYGFPVSELITTRLRADLVYLAMKPLEYIFILTLYLFDPHPENRIAVQYSDYKGESR